MATKKKPAAARKPAGAAKTRARKGAAPARRTSVAPKRAPRAAKPPVAKEKRGLKHRALPPESEPAQAARAEAEALAPDPNRETAVAIAKAGLDKKAEDVLVLDVRGLTSYADYFVVMSADSERQAGAIADHVDEIMKKAGTSKVGVEGHAGGRWVLIDFGDVVAHVFNRESRGFYDLEGLWADAPRFAIEG